MQVLQDIRGTFNVVCDEDDAEGGGMSDSDYKYGKANDDARDELQ